ncbi:MAG: helix-turn-helix domain-containing protein [Myxococcota bacterium]
MDSILRMGFENPQRPNFPLEVVSLAELRRKAPPGALARPLRPLFHQLAFVTRGRFVYEVDFERIAVKPGVVVWVHPEQIQRLHLPASCEGWLLLFMADLLDPNSHEGSAGSIQGGIALGALAADVDWLLTRLRRLAAPGASTGSEAFALLRHLLGALLLLVRQAAAASFSTSDSRGSQVFDLFRSEVERRFAKTRRLRDYERHIGYSGKTLTRAVQAATGLTAKQYIDQRVALEARRLLAHTADSAGSIGAALGFSELTNFTKFFRRETGTTPGAFRESFSKSAVT